MSRRFPSMLFTCPTPSLKVLSAYVTAWCIFLLLQRLLLRVFLRLTVGKYENYGLQTPDHQVPIPCCRRSNVTYCIHRMIGRTKLILLLVLHRVRLCVFSVNVECTCSICTAHAQVYSRLSFRNCADLGPPSDDQFRTVKLFEAGANRALSRYQAFLGITRLHV